MPSSGYNLSVLYKSYEKTNGNEEESMIMTQNQKGRMSKKKWQEEESCYNFCIPFSYDGNRVVEMLVELKLYIFGLNHVILQIFVTIAPILYCNVAEASF